jgi:hypothetical protein
MLYMSQYEVDQFTTPVAWQELQNHYRAIDQAAGALGLRGVDESEGPALFFGSGAHAWLFIDSRIPGRKPSDLDIVVPPTMFRRLGHSGVMRSATRFKQYGFHGVIPATEEIPLKVDVLTTTNPSELSLLLGDEPYTGSVNGSVQLADGVHVLDPDVVAWQKVIYKGNRVKDLAGVIKAHVVAEATGNPVTKLEKWQGAVARAIDRVTDQRVPRSLWRTLTRRGPAYPSWLQQLVDADFDHPAFAHIVRED